MQASRRILNADALTRHGNVAGRRAIVDILEAGLTAANPYYNTRALFSREGNRLIVGSSDAHLENDPGPTHEVVDLDEVERVYVVGAGKGIQYAAKALEDVLGERLTAGHVIDKHGSPHILERIGVTYGAHPVPDEGCVLGCQRIIETLKGLTPRDLVFTVIGNGVSALLTLPAPGVSLEDVRQTTHFMQIVRGALTQHLNPVRNHLDRLKGGRICRTIQPARAIHILTAPSPTWDWLMAHNFWYHTLPEGWGYQDAIDMLKKYDAWEHVPASVRRHLERADPALDTVKADEYLRMPHRIWNVMPSSRGMVPVARQRAQELGFSTHCLYTQAHFEAAPAGLMTASMALHCESASEPFAPPCALFGSHELIVTVGEGGGMGGRNQEWALSAARRISGSERIVMGSVDSDGTDGPGHQFGGGDGGVPVLGGAIVDGDTLRRAAERGFDVDAELRRHNVSPVLYKSDCGVLVSPNISVNDLTVTLVLGHEQTSATR